MTSWPRYMVIPIAFGALILDPRSGGVDGALAQLSPGQLPQQPGLPEATTKPEGVAEQAEVGPDQLPTTPVLPPDKSEAKRFELIQLDGYFRFRTDWFKNFHLGFHSELPGGAPFPVPLGCRELDPTTDKPVGPCSDTLKGANMRLRLEPTINVAETARVHLHLDMLDNVVMGSTPAFPGGPFIGPGTVVPPDDWTRAINVRRIWAEVDTGLGHLTVGRQPWHWGLGIYANAGGFDPFAGTYNYDADFGTTVDRAMFRTQVPGTNIDAALATDWPSTYPASFHDPLLAGRPRPWDLGDHDDISRWVVMLTRFDRPDVFTETMARGELAFNYGAFLAYTTQEWATVPAVDDGFVLIRRDLTSYTPNVWLRLGWDELLLELEGTAIIGSIGNVSDVELPMPITESVDLRSFAGVARARYRALENKLGLGLELGYASGDTWRNNPAGVLHVSHALPLPVGGADRTVSNFYFNPDYHIDLILFRELVGTVTNALYVRPSMSYQFTDQLLLSGQVILSMAAEPESTPGQSRFYGAELNGFLTYNHGPFLLGAAYGVLLPMAALDHLASDDFGTGENVGSAGTAQTFQTTLIVRF